MAPTAAGPPAGAASPSPAASPRRDRRRPDARPAACGRRRPSWRAASGGARPRAPPRSRRSTSSARRCPGARTSPQPGPAALRPARRAAPSANAESIRRWSGAASSSAGCACPVANSTSRKLNRPCWRLLTSGARRRASSTACGSANPLRAFRRTIASSSSSGYTSVQCAASQREATPSVSRKGRRPSVLSRAAARYVRSRKSLLLPSASTARALISGQGSAGRAEPADRTAGRRRSRPSTASPRDSRRTAGRPRLACPARGHRWSFAVPRSEFYANVPQP